LFWCVLRGRFLTHLTSDAQLRIGESRDSGSGPSDHPGMTIQCDAHNKDRTIRPSGRRLVGRLCCGVSDFE
jgi:hypothetical protein